MQGARRANIPAIFNRRVPPRAGHRFPNADVCLERDTSTRPSPVFTAGREERFLTSAIPQFLDR
jgi:hypothetical protein